MASGIIAWIGVIVLLAAFTQAVSGFGFSIFAIPLLALLIGPWDAVVLATVLSCVLSVGAAVVYRREVEWAVVLRVSASAVVGLPLGLLIAHLLPERVLTVVIAVCVVLAAVFVGLIRPRAAGAPSRGIAAGVLSGALLTSTGMNGPPLVLSFNRLPIGARRIRATLQSAFAVQDVLAIAGFAAVGRIGPSLGWLPLLMAPVLVAGWGLGALLFNRLPTRYFTRIAMWLLIATGCYAAISEIL